MHGGTGNGSDCGWHYNACSGDDNVDGIAWDCCLYSRKCLGCGDDDGDGGDSVMMVISGVARILVRGRP